MRLSLAMIVKNEETLIGRVLDSAATVCDELIVVDTGSTDATREIAEERGASVHEVAWRDDFATARNASFAWCTGDWILWLDADDVVPAPTQQAIGALKDWLNDDVDAVAGPYHYSIADNGTVLLNVFRERLIRRQSGLRWEGKVHEVISLPAGRSVFVPELVIEHRPDPQRRALNVDRNMKILEAEMEEGIRARGPSSTTPTSCTTTSAGARRPTGTGSTSTPTVWADPTGTGRCCTWPKRAGCSATTTRFAMPRPGPSR